ncbi:hypothetical protein C7974DRAFT_373833 [Boeremia exigua]|uniref:uncharacterized protein n=1 Tax=Boeremia exigua TaxID=749465 RepID=UPI001E8D021E|nr:uncharacterized protein C7974DRAFT_373833 [Boeremia exigua]KAH6639613.1 hypothetical protein C7974DRAFT_373833 [Boeremia exigua]
MSSISNSSGTAYEALLPRPRISAPDSVVVTLLVGVQRFVVHESALIYHSGLFRTALSKKFKDPENEELDVQDVDPDTFEVFVHWLYYQQLPRKDGNDDKAVVDTFYSHYSGDAEFYPFTKLYVFAVEYDVAGLCRDIIDLLFHLTSDLGGDLAGGEAIAHAFNNLKETGSMCRLLVDLQCRFDNPHDVQYDRYTCVEFLQAVWERYVRITCSGTMQIDDDLELCDYHDHPTEGERIACEKERRICEKEKRAREKALRE